MSAWALFLQIHTGVCLDEIFSSQKYTQVHERTSLVDQVCSWLLQHSSSLGKKWSNCSGRKAHQSEQVNPWLWQFWRGKPRLGGLTVKDTAERMNAACNVRLKVSQGEWFEVKSGRDLHFCVHESMYQYVPASCCMYLSICMYLQVVHLPHSKIRLKNCMFFHFGHQDMLYCIWQVYASIFQFENHRGATWKLKRM
jgi:hypothetical protein